MKRIFPLLLLLLFYQNCSDVGLIKNTDTLPSIKSVEFDLDIKILGEEYVTAFENKVATCRNGRLALFEKSPNTQLVDEITFIGSCSAIAMYQNTVAITNDDRVQIYQVENNELTLKQTINKESFSNSLSNYGKSISIGNNLLVVSDMFQTVFGAIRAGSAYVYQKNQDTWVFDQELTAGDAASTELFGHQVEIDNNFIYISARYDNNRGAIYVFNKNSNWVQVDKIISPLSLENEQFGFSFSIEDNYLAVAGVAVVSEPSELTRGQVYIFKKVNSWEHQQTLSAEVVNNDNQFGFKVSLAFPHIAIAATESFSEDKSGFIEFFTLQETWLRTGAIHPNNIRHFGSDLILTNHLLAAKGLTSTGSEVHVFTIQPTSN